MASVVICEPWMGGSHRAWAKGIQEHSDHRVMILGLPDEAWRWRLRASAPWFAEMLARQPAPDLIVASGLVDAAALRGLIGREVRFVLYLHESQGAYPSPTGEWDLESVTTNWRSMLAADEVWFNSAFHRREALEQIERLEAEMPFEQRLEAEAPLADRCRVVYPGVDLDWAEARPAPTPPTSPVILWPHRWESDKNPAVFESALARLAEAKVDFGLVLAGEVRPGGSGVLDRIVARHADRLVAAGPFDRDEYRRWVLHSDIVVSCTNHEFFGIAIVEALAAGCVPVLPDAFSYPELVGSSSSAILYEPGSFGSALEAAVRSFDPASRLSIDVSHFDWCDRITDFDTRIADVVANTRSPKPT